MATSNSTQPPFHPNPGRPRVTPPPGSWDTHFHVFEPGAGQAAAAGAAYRPLQAPAAALEAMHRALGIERGVLIQNTAVKVNYEVFADELRGNPRLAGVAVIDDNTTDAELQKLHDVRVRGVRFHFAAFIKKRPTMATFERAVDRIAALGWHVLVHCEPKDLMELAPVFAKLQVPLIIDHIAHMNVADGLDQPAFKKLLELHRREHVWVKIANSDRWSEVGPPTYADGVPFGRALIANAPERLVWGTDWPHVMYRNPHSPGDPPPDEANLLNLLYDMAANDEAVIRRILVDNPLRLYPLGI